MIPNMGDIFLHKKSGREYVIGYTCKHGKTGSNLPTIVLYRERTGKSCTYYRKVSDFDRSPDSGYKYIGNIFDPYAEEQ